MESWGKQIGLLWSAFCPQWGDHHVRGISEEGLNPSFDDLSLEWPQTDTFLHHNQLIDAPLLRSPTGTFSQSLCPLRGGDSHAPLAGKQLCHPHSGPWHGETVYLALSDNIDHSADSAGPYNQRDPPSELRLIGHHKEHRIFIISCDSPHLHMQDDKPEQASTFPA